MAYDRKKIFEQAKEVSLSDGCNMLKDKFKNEKTHFRVFRERL